MTTQLLEQFSSALAERAAAAQAAIAAIRLHDARHLSAALWQPEVAIASEQSLPRRDEFELVAAGGATLKAKLAGRDPGTNLAVLRLERALDAPAWTNGEPIAGALALAFGADGAGGVRARLGIANPARPEWASRARGRLDRYIDLRLAPPRPRAGGPGA